MKKKNVIAIIVAIAVLFVLFQLILFISHQHKLTTAEYGTITNTLSFKGYLVKEEKVITSSAAGILQPAVSDGQKIAKDSRIGAIMSGEADETTIRYYMDLTDRIETIEKIASGDTSDTMRLEEQITDLSVIIAKETVNGKTAKVSENKAELVKLLDRKAVLNGERDSLISELTSKKSEIKKEIGSDIKELYAPEAGMFSSKVDGFENILTPETMDSINVSDIEEMENTREEAAKGSYKIINNYRWYIAALVDENLPEGISTGNIISMKINDVESDAVNAIVYRISEPENGKRVVILSCSRDCGGVLTKRRVSGDITINSFSGLRIPSSAIIERDGETGVLCEYLGESVFKKGEILTKNDKYAIIRDKKGEKNYLQPYDEIIVQ